MPLRPDGDKAEWERYKINVAQYSPSQVMHEEVRYQSKVL
jgi:hypothetical protein